MNKNRNMLLLILSQIQVCFGSFSGSHVTDDRSVAILHRTLGTPWWHRQRGTDGTYPKIKATTGLVFSGLSSHFFSSSLLIFYFSVCRSLFLWGLRLPNINRGSNLNLMEQRRTKCMLGSKTFLTKVTISHKKDVLTVNHKRQAFCRSVPSTTATSLTDGSSSPRPPDRCS